VFTEKNRDNIIPILRDYKLKIILWVGMVYIWMNDITLILR
jgi:hypothetical protein